MTVVICGRTNLSERAEQLTRVLREQQGFRTDGGCGRSVDLDNDIQHMRVYRCRECSRWLCGPCMDQHFQDSRSAGTAAFAADQGRRDYERAEVRDATAPGKPEQATHVGGAGAVPSRPRSPLSMDSETPRS